jgi:glycosyl-4,4'-diaponeurosporenoate acyltransferase
MPIELPVTWIAILNVVLWPVIQLALAWVFTRVPVSCLSPPATPAGESAAFYEKVLRIKRWKNLLPDGAKWIGGAFSMREMKTTDPSYLQRFIVETWRGELCHLSAFLFVPVFFLWNPWWGNCVIVAYALVANLPCIVAQRYNRLRLRQLLNRIKEAKPHE